MQFDSGQPMGFMVMKLVTAGGVRGEKEKKIRDGTCVNWLGLVGFFLFFFLILFCLLLFLVQNEDELLRSF